MIVCPECGVKGNYDYDGAFISCNSCGWTEWAKTEKDGYITHLWDKWNKEEQGGIMNEDMIDKIMLEANKMASQLAQDTEGNFKFEDIDIFYDDAYSAIREAHKKERR